MSGIAEQTQRKVVLKKAPRYCNVFYNNQITPVEVVMVILNSVFGLSKEEAEQKTLEIHNSKKGIIFINSKEICDFKDEQVKEQCMNFGEKYLEHSVEVYEQEL